MARVFILPDEIALDLPDGTPFVRALWQAGVAVETPCGGFGVCGKCKVRFTGGAVPDPTEEELRHVSASELAEGWRLACRHRVTGDAEVVVPAESRPAIAQVLTTAVERAVPLEPAVRRLPLQLPAPSTSDERSDLRRLLDALHEQHGVKLEAEQVPLSVTRQLPQVVREADFHPFVVLFHDPDHPAETRLLAVQSDDATPLLGIAFDIGTTTLVGYLIDLQNGKEMAYAARLNPQVQYGDDVVSRLTFVYHDPTGLKLLQHAVVRGLNEIIAEACQSAGVDPQHIFEVVAVGNTTMLHFLLGVNTNSIAVAPYVPVFTDLLSVEARQIGLRVNPSAVLTTLPCVAGYVGADTVAVTLTHLHDPDDETVLALDIGTNGEVVLRHRGKYYCTSAAAGPAFEGGRIYQGIRAEVGAVAQISVESNGENHWLHITTIGGGLPKGICGSGLIDAAACLLDIGAVNEAGRMNNNGDGKWWESHLTTLCEQKAFQLVAPEASGIPEGIVLTQKDVRELQLAKGSIRAVTEVLLQEAGIRWADVHRVLVAGAFGMYVNLRSAQRIGLLPPVPLERIEPVGNAAGAGAKIALRSVRERKRAEWLAQQMKHVVMTGNPQYQEAYMDHLGFVETLD
ncbi:Na(+)-translocating NADH-quinone reductase subunit F [bacterium HR16]|nr:Na(+)-translocating NADH-quinone reductase subunit F [bacterium HR16]